MNKNKSSSFAALAAVSLSATADVPANARLDWIIGHWCSDAGGEFIEERWLEHRGDILLGLSRTVKGAKTSSFEFLRIEWAAGVPSYIAQPQGRPPVAFKLTASGADWARFENPAHDFPNRVEYRRTNDGLHAEIAGPGEGGKELVIPFEYRQCAR